MNRTFACGFSPSSNLFFAANAKVQVKSTSQKVVTHGVLYLFILAPRNAYPVLNIPLRH